MTKLSLVPGGGSAQLRFEALVAPHYATLYRIAYRFSGTTSDAEDLVQETCARACRHLDRLMELEDPRGWMICVMRRLFIDQTRRFDRSHVSSIDAAELDPIASDQPGPADVTESEQMASRIEKSLKKLSKEHRTLLVLHDMEGYSLAELEVITGVTVGTIKSRLHRARVKLGRLLRSELDQAPYELGARR